LALERGTFRLDLFHRLNVFPITMPPLRERGDDIAMLANAFLREFSERSGRRMRFSEGALEALGHYSWDGNVRELRNLVQRAHILTEGDVIESLPRPAMLEADEAITSDDAVVLPVESTLEELDRALVNATLAKCGGVKAHAAEILDVSLKTLYNRLDGDGKTGTA
jgi:DNA-binding NtrC family response regulator